MPPIGSKWGIPTFQNMTSINLTQMCLTECSHGGPLVVVTRLVNLNNGVALSPQCVSLMQQWQQQLVQCQWWNSKTQTDRLCFWASSPQEPPSHSLVIGYSHRTWSDNSGIDLIRFQKLCYGVSPWAKCSKISLAYPRVEMQETIRKKIPLEEYSVMSLTIIHFFLVHFHNSSL